MKIEKIVCVLFLSAAILFSQGILSNEILDIEVGRNLIVTASKEGVSFKDIITDWQNIKSEPFSAKIGANLDNIVLLGGTFAVRLEPKRKDEISILFANGRVIDHKISAAAEKHDMQLFGYDGYGNLDAKNFFFAIGDGGVAVFNIDGGLNNMEIETKIIEADFCVNSINNNYKSPHSFIALSPDGKIMHYDNIWTKLDGLKLKQNEYAIKFIKDFSDTSILVLTTDTTIYGSENLYRWSENGSSLIYNGDISKTIVTPDRFIYILESSGRLIVRDINAKESDSSRQRQEILLRRIDKSNATPNFILTDISIYTEGIYNEAKASSRLSLHPPFMWVIGLSSDKGIFYSADEENGIKNEIPFEFINKPVPLKPSLKEVYAEPGIITTSENFCTFEYSLSEDDRVTIDIFNYNLDFVCRIIENELRQASKGDRHSTNRQMDRWDGTMKNNGGRVVAPGVYYFKITTQKGKSAVGKVVVARK